MEGLKSACSALPGRCGSLILALGGANPAIVPELGELAAEIKQCTSKSAVKVAVKNEIDTERGEAVTSLEAQSFQQPRGAFAVEILEQRDGLCLVSKTTQYLIPRDNIIRCIELPVPQQASRLLFVLREKLPVGKSFCSCLLMTLKPSPKSKELSIKLEKQAYTDTPSAAWRKALGTLKSPLNVDEPSSQYFSGSRGNAALKCYHSVNDGYLFPLPSGVAFIQKPTLFLSNQDIERIELGRQAQGGARNFDVNIQMVDGTAHEIRMIEKEEMGPLSAYVLKTGVNDEKKKKKNVAQMSSNGSENGKTKVDGDDNAADDDDESDDDKEDSDFSSSGVSDDEYDGEKQGSGDDDSDEQDDESEESESDRDSDIDDGDIDLTKMPVKDEDEKSVSSIVERMKKRRRRGEEPQGAPKSSSSSSSSSALQQPVASSSLSSSSLAPKVEENDTATESEGEEEASQMVKKQKT